MKLSERLAARMAKPEKRGYVSPVLLDPKHLNEIRTLEEKAQLLDDLAEMLWDASVNSFMFADYSRDDILRSFHMFDDTEEKINGDGQTKIEAIRAAVTAWKESKK